ncbi:DUF3265 domain-containing protein [Vibrio cincinnatiensis]|nr:DUF3265 domain-containing protein [Vibrio cincinnatiensis]
MDSAAQRLRSTNGLRGTANAWHFYHALVFCDYGVMRKLGSGVGCPLTERYVPLRFIRTNHYESQFLLTGAGHQKCDK